MVQRRTNDNDGDHVQDGPRVDYDDPQFVVDELRPRTEHIKALTVELQRASVCVLPGVASPYQLACVPDAAVLESAYGIWVSMWLAANDTGGAMALFVPVFVVILRHMALMSAGHGADELLVREGALADIGYDVLLRRGGFPNVQVTIYPRRSGAVPRSVSVDEMLRAGVASHDIVATALAHNATPDSEIRRIAAGTKN